MDEASSSRPADPCPVAIRAVLRVQAPALLRAALQRARASALRQAPVGRQAALQAEPVGRQAALQAEPAALRAWVAPASRVAAPARSKRCRKSRQCLTTERSR